jgi:poly(hydroxyalkanoate) granule-associated protein
MAKRKKDEKTGHEPWDSARHVWLAGLGALSAAGEEGEKLFRSLVDRGEKVEERVRGNAKQARRKAEATRAKAARALDGLESAFDERVASLLGRLGVPTRDEVAALGRKVERLTKVVDGKRAGGAAGGAKRATKAKRAKTERKAKSAKRKPATGARKTARKKPASKRRRSG